MQAIATAKNDFSLPTPGGDVQVKNGETFCGRLTTYGVSPMPTIPTKHSRPVWAGERKAFERIVNKRQYSTFYNSSAWRTLAKAHKAANPLCANHATCKGVAEITDHITPISEGGDRYAWDNLQSLCKRCNASKTGKQAAQRGAGEASKAGGV